MSVFNELVITGSISKVNDTISGELTHELVTEASVSIPDVIGDTPFEGPYEVTPTFTNQTLKTAAKTMVQNLKVKKIQTYEVSNLYGRTFII